MVRRVLDVRHKGVLSILCNPTEDLVDPDGQQKFWICVAENEQASPSNLKTFLLQAPLVDRTHRRQSQDFLLGYYVSEDALSIYQGVAGRR